MRYTFSVNLGLPELLLLLLIVLLVFGAKRLPELARSLGEAMREFRKAQVGEPEDSQKDNSSRCSEEDK